MKMNPQLVLALYWCSVVKGQCLLEFIIVLLPSYLLGKTSYVIDILQVTYCQFVSCELLQT